MNWPFKECLFFESKWWGFVCGLWGFHFLGSEKLRQGCDCKTLTELSRSLMVFAIVTLWPGQIWSLCGKLFGSSILITQRTWFKIKKGILLVDSWWKKSTCIYYFVIIDTCLNKLFISAVLTYVSIDYITWAWVNKKR